MRTFLRESGAARVVLIITCASVAGCGGGGGGSGAPTPQNRTPVLGLVQFTTNEDTDVSSQVTATDADGDALTFSRTSDPTKGSVTAFATNGSFTYRPNPDATGSDTFSVRAADAASSVVGTVTIQITAVNDPPAARDDTLAVTSGGVANVEVIANDVEVDGDALAVSIESAAEVGTVAVNANNSIAISGLPAGFRGVTRFRYRATDPSGSFSVATAAVFVDVDPFRVVFAGDEPGQDSPELFITNLASAPVQLSSATEGTLRLRGFVSALNGSTVAYRRHDRAQGNAPVDLSFVRTADPSTQVRIVLPNGMVQQPVVGLGQDTYVVSPDGQWIAGIASKQPSGRTAFLVNVAAPAVVHTASPPDTFEVRSLQFSADSQHLYYVAAVPSNGSGNFSLYRVAVATPDERVPLSATPSGSLTDQVLAYLISDDQSKIVLWGWREDSLNLMYVNTANPRTEIRINDELDPTDEVVASSVQFGPPGGTARVAYSVRAEGILISKNFVAEVSATPNPRPVAPDGYVVHGMRPDGQAVALSGGASGTELVEALVDSGLPPALIGEGRESFSVRYDSRGDALFMQVANLIPPDNVDTYLTIGAAVRPTFGTIQHVGTPDRSALFTNFTGTDRAIVLMGEGPPTVIPGVAGFRIALANAWVPDKLLYLTDLTTPRTLRGLRAQVVDP